MQRAESIAVHHSGFGRPGLVHRLVTAKDREGVQRRLRRLGLIERLDNDLDWRQLFPADEPRRLARIEHGWAVAHGLNR
jgi:hypothetical protein